VPVSAVITPDSALTRATPKSATLMSWKGATGYQFEVNFGCSIVEIQEEKNITSHCT
jgi:hypothetical protein